MGNPLKGADPESLDAAALPPPDVETSPATDRPSSPPPSGTRHSPGMEPVSLSADINPATVVGSRRSSRNRITSKPTNIPSFSSK